MAFFVGPYSLLVPRMHLVGAGLVDAERGGATERGDGGAAGAWVGYVFAAALEGVVASRVASP